MSLVYEPLRAALLSRARCRNAALPASRLAGSPFHALSAGACRARPVGEAELPRVRPEAVDGVEVRGRELVGLTARQEHDAGHRGGHRPLEAAHRGARDVVDRRLLGAAVPRQHHVRLEQHALERDVLVHQRVERRLEHASGRDPRLLDGVLAVHEHFGLDDGHDAGFLAERGVPRERVRVDVDAVVARQALADGVGRAPLRETRAELVVLGQSLAKAVEPFGDRLAVGERERLRAGVDLDAGDDPLVFEHLHELGAVGGRLTDRLVEQDDAADEVAGARRGEQHLAVVATVGLVRLDADGVEPLLDRAAALVGGKDPLARRDERARGGFEVGNAHGNYSHSMVPGGLLVMS